MGRSLHLQLTGAPRLLADGAERRLPGRRVLALLACLALEGPATRARLASLLWAQLDEPSARRNLRRELARLRESGLDGVVAGDEVLALAAGLACDATDFDAALAQDDAELALAVWRGPLLDGFELGDAPAFDGWLAERREALARRWRDAADTAARRREAGGDLRGALELRLRLVDADPLCEPEVANAMRLHERLGDRKAALALFERSRSLLMRELGLAPMAETLALAERLRAGERVAGVLPRAVRPAWERVDAPLVGREAAAARLRESTAPVLLVSGDPGIGKTRLAQEALRARHTVVLRCSPQARGAALQPVADVLADALSRLASAERLGDLSPQARRELSRLVPAFDPEAPAEPARNDAAAQRRFLDAVADALDALAGGAGAGGRREAERAEGTWLVDDLHWADEGTLALVRHGAHRRAQAPARHARIVATARATELAGDAAAQATVLALEREGLLERLPLEPLAEADTLALVRELSGSEGGALFARRLQRATLGNPYHLLETLRFLFDAGELQVDERGGWITRYDDATADYAELPVPPSVAQTVVERLDRLGTPARRVLEAAALAGDGFTLDDVQPATALSEFEALDGLERALQARLIADAEPGYRFVHDLARGAIEASLGVERRRRVHARLAQGLLARGGRADRIAAHLEGAGDRAAAAPWRLRAAMASQRVFARREALVHLDAALADGPEPADEVECRRRRVMLLRSLGDLEAAWAEFDRLEPLAASAGDPAARFRTRLMAGVRMLDRGRYDAAVELCGRLEDAEAPTPADELERLRLGGFAALHLDRGPLAEQWLARALAVAESIAAPERLGIEANLIHLRLSRGALQAGAELGARALARVEADASPIEHAMLLNAAARAQEALGERERALGLLDAALATLRATQSGLFVTMMQLTRVRMLLEQGHLPEARAGLEAMEGALGSTPQPRHHYVQRMLQARLHWAEGDVAAALATLEGARELLRDTPAVAANATLLLARWRALTGDLQGALEVAGQAAALADPEPPLLAVEAIRAWHALAAGDAAGARARLEAARTRPTALDEFWVLHDELARCLQGAAALAQGDRDAALAAVADVRWAPALQALAWAVRVAAGAAPDGARALLAAGGVPPVEAALLEGALAGRRPFG